MFGNANASHGAFDDMNAVRNVGRGAFGNANAVRNIGRGTFGNAILNRKFEKKISGKTYCRGGSRLNCPYKYLFVGAAGTTAAPTNRFVGAAGNTSRPYKSICRGGLGTAPTNA